MKQYESINVTDSVVVKEGIVDSEDDAIETEKEEEKDDAKDHDDTFNNQLWRDE